MTNNEQYPAHHEQNGDNEDQPRCVECKQEFYLGDEMIRLDTGVLGGKGFVPLPTERTSFLCNSECARRYFIPEEDLVPMKRRIP